MSVLQTRYPVRKRGKETVYVLLEAMSAGQLDQNIAHLRQVAAPLLEKGRACQQHADELQQYRQQRFPGTANGRS